MTEISQHSASSSEYSCESDSPAPPVPAKCFVCQKTVAGKDLSSICNCTTLQYHETCLSKHFLDGKTTCQFCNSDFRLVVQTSVAFSQKRFAFFVNCFKNFFLTILSISAILFLIAPYDWVNLFQSKKSLYTVELGQSGSPVLFPSLPYVLLDVLYFTIVGILFVGGVVFEVIETYFGSGFLIKFWKKNTYAHTICAFTIVCLCYILASHAFGLFHYAFYYGVGVLTDKIWFTFHLDWRTFMAGPAGFILFSGFTVFPCVSIYGLWRLTNLILFKYCCITVNRQVVVKK